MTTIMVNRVHYPVRTLGPGRRAGIWFQGCTIGCRGCASRDTWPVDPARRVDVDEVLSWLDGLPEPDGVTLTGGEPFQQPQGLVALLHGIDRWRGRGDVQVDVLLYSGYQLGVLRRRSCWEQMSEFVDALVVGPYIERLSPGGLWRGSANQRLVPMSDLGRRRYAGAGDRSGERRLQVSTDGESLWLVGIPGPGDLSHLERTLVAGGIERQEVSWRP